MIRQNIATIIATIDKHDAGIYPEGMYVCPCSFRGTEEQWQAHIADLLEEQLAEVVELPL